MAKTRTATRTAANAMPSIAAAALVLLVFACAGRLPRPVYVAQPTSALAEVGYPPPPARVELVPKQPSSDAVWIDGEWQWQGRRWAWRIGRWVVPPEGAKFSPWMMVRGADGVVFYAEGTWRDASHHDIAEPAPLATGRPTLSDVPDPEGELEKTGNSIRPQDLKSVDGGEGPDAGSSALDAGPVDAAYAYQDR
jgi:hypothetical protein